MTGRTHDLTAFTALNMVFVSEAIPEMSLATAIVALGANLLGGVAPDADQPTGALWDKFPASSLIGHLAHPFIGAHRHLSHSLLGLVLVGWLLNFLLTKIGTVVLVDMTIVWWSFMIGYFSHLVVDSFTIDGVPWLFPISLRIGMPIKTGGLIEKSLFFPSLLILNGYLFFLYYPKYIAFLKNIIKLN